MEHNTPPICEDCRHKHTLKSPKRSRSMTAMYCPYKGRDITLCTTTCRHKKPTAYPDTPQQLILFDCQDCAHWQENGCEYPDNPPCDEL